MHHRQVACKGNIADVNDGGASWMENFCLNVTLVFLVLMISSKYRSRRSLYICAKAF